MKRRSSPVERSHRQNYKKRVARRGGSSHPMPRPRPPWWLREPETAQAVTMGPFHALTAKRGFFPEKGRREE